MPESLNLKKIFSQNFIQSSEVIDDIIHASEIGGDDFVIEIGPGAGALTIPLADVCGHIAAIEVDKRLVKLLREAFADNPAVKIVFDDVIDTDFNEILDHEHAENFSGIKFIGNIPYNITSPIITKVLQCGIDYDNFTVMVQKEVADRMVSPPGKRAYGFLSVFVQYYTEPLYIRTVGRELFLPVPNVDSAVVKLTRRKAPPVDCDEKLFFEVVRQSFSMKRKTLANNLSGYKGLDKASASKLLESIGIEPRRRAETLTLEEFAKLANALAGDASEIKKIIKQDETSSELSKW